ncbi:globoside alpha-1,3-N-acetylgalactosaminyltransferase 1-like isoform X1 [Puntigrus tetrazona]|uniref:globoside alpha-1,3-N-acetylgalactosaminyltransferase 1-like isoform X1 n=1 Tax=Puntigrus tetrazona TaxID=1606681 RepID=UPI001C8A5F89|nr:globoside alpha-1,3-N-acetylgalactosaminyltransferase 1-like isoform X1 [Puntigrus tetrazona]XP_043101978.1 globoside alpha-1,3-N-acetylgalactosaminyltransferase 1-like isoform X1 [Puntigrus tetrazona]XP_043101979.1 globoside alpha-1,3-N-acetylgalactosaminyltransferase 1-like isoform X1 [Puntigrus tetrazona]XP_043101980.1 globoside alpha-1,3-N-acetylgalactosaminyltransferase 1-like isoform X1 [Puntigrus tetrazona]
MRIPGIMLPRHHFFITIVIFGMVLSGFIYWNNVSCSCKQQITKEVIMKQKWKQKTFGLRSSPGLLYSQPNVLVGRTDIASVSPWAAPIIWEGTFDPTLIDSIYKQHNLTIATTVFALGKYTRFIKDFLESAEQHYFVGFRVHFYLFTDQPESVPEVKMGENRTLKIQKVQTLNRWQDISMSRMEKLEKLIEEELANEADYIFCLDIDAKFYGRWGAETLGRLVGVIHPWLYNVPRNQFTYERRPESKAFIAADEGDYYYAGAAFGGTLEEVHHLTKTCREQLSIDAANSIEAAWQEESHLNKYFLLNKPSKLLSPEYMWRDINVKVDPIKIVRFTNVPKNYAEVRPNV